MTWTGPAAGREAVQRTAPAGHRLPPARQRGRPLIDPARLAA